MKKKVKQLFLVMGIVLLLFIVGKVIKIIYTFENASVIVDNSNLDYNILGHMPKKDMEAYHINIVEGFNLEKGFSCYLIKNDNTTYTIKGFPDTLSSYYVTSFHTTNNKYYIFDIRVGDNINDANIIMKKRGYNRDDEYTFRRGIITIHFVCEDDIIMEIYINIPATNILNLIF